MDVSVQPTKESMGDRMTILTANQLQPHVDKAFGLMMQDRYDLVNDEFARLMAQRADTPAMIMAVLLRATWHARETLSLWEPLREVSIQKCESEGHDPAVMLSGLLGDSKE